MKLKIEGMSCNHCVNAVRRALESVPGVDRVAEVNLESGEAEIEGSADPALLVSAIQDEGYKAEPAE